VFEENDERYFVSVECSRTERLVVITSASKLTTEVWLFPTDAVTDDPAAILRLVAPRDEGVEYHVEHHVSAQHGDRLFVLTNADGAENFKLMVAATASPGRKEWEPFIPHRPDVRLDDVDAFAGHLVLSERREGLTRLRVHRLADGDEHELAMPDPVYACFLGSNPEFDVTEFRFEYSSLVTPPSTFAYDIDTRTSRLIKRQEVAGYEPARYEARREWATADDGARIPISLVVPRDRPAGEPGPMLLYGYGSYEVSVDPTFSVSRLSLLERGFGFGIAHVRGGGEMGRRWYEDGKLDRKQHTFSDFVACARHLIDRGLTRPELLVARGGSAGGLLMGVVANTAPELFCAIVAEVPFVDCLTTILDASLPLTVTEWEEWGNPVTDDHIYRYLRAYSPYDNVRAGPYPAMLVTGGMNDPRVQYWEPAKWVAKLRSRKTDDRLLVLKMEMDAGHSGPSGRYDAWRDEAFVLAFVLDQVGIAQ
jgi:oligopeptidase B